MKTIELKKNSSKHTQFLRYVKMFLSEVYFKKIRVHMCVYINMESLHLAIMEKPDYLKVYPVQKHFHNKNESDTLLMVTVLEAIRYLATKVIQFELKKKPR